jgi:hypothetical protein
MSKLAKLCVLQLMFVLIACGGDGPTAEDQNRLVGRYLLITVDGESVPFVIQESGPRLVLRSGFLDFVSNDDVDIGFTFEFDDVPEVFEDRSGYRRRGSELTIYLVSGVDTTAVAGVVNGNDVTILDRDPSDPSAPPITLLYRKR